MTRPNGDGSLAVSPNERRAAKPLNHASFTLVELMVVIAVSGILAALWLPALAQAKKRGQRIQCVGNLRQLGVGLQTILSNDHGYPLLVGDGRHGDTSWIGQLASEGLGTAQAMTNYIRNDPCHCPSVVWLKEDTNLLAICYGYNSGGVVSDGEADINFGLGGRPSTKPRCQIPKWLIPPI
jgi:prepilin-type N-terminal cleavage/methylation domain-containing protein